MLRHEALHYLTAFVAAHQAGDGTAYIALRLPTSMFADRRTVIERCVIATLYPLKSSGDPHPTYSVTWSPKGDGPSPKFAGALAVEKTARDDRFDLSLRGHYEPFGSMFDTTRGRRIVYVWVRGLLRSIAGYVESARAHNDAAHAGHSPLTHLTRVRTPSDASQRSLAAGPDLQLSSLAS